MKGAVIAVAHATLLAAPIALVGRARALLEPHALACLFLLVLLSIVEGRLAAPEAMRRSARVGTVLAFASSLSLLTMAWCSIGSRSPAASGLGVVPLAAGIALRARSLRDLGPFFTSGIEPAADRLVVQGIYARLRHPSEAGLLLCGAGVVLFGGSVVGLLIFAVVMLPSILLRVIAEDRALSAQFGTVHARYQQRVGGLFPRWERG